MRTTLTCLLAVCATVAAAATPSMPDDSSANCPVFRDDGTGVYEGGSLPSSWNEGEKTNIRWAKELSLPGWACPIIWGDKVVATGANQDDRAVYCLDLANGDIVWQTDIPLGKGTEDYLVDSMDARWDEILYAAATPATNGKQVFVAFSTGQLVALDLHSGEKLWEVGLGDTEINTYGLTNSTLVYKDMVIQTFEGDTQFIAAYDAATGEERWKSERQSATWASPILIKTPAGQHQVVLSADPDVTAWNPENGEQLWSVDVLTGGPEWCVGPTPIYAGGLVFANCEACGIYAIDPDKGETVWSNEDLDAYPDGTSMVSDGEKLYQYFGYELNVLDCKTGELLQTVEMDDEASYASPALADGKLYLLGMVETFVCDPAKDCAIIGTGAVSDMRDASPAIVDGNIVIRSDNKVYCIANVE